MLACIKGGIGRDYLEFIYVAMPADGNSLAHGSAKNYQTADEAHPTSCRLHYFRRGLLQPAHNCTSSYVAAARNPHRKMGFQCPQQCESGQYCGQPALHGTKFLGIHG